MVPPLLTGISRRRGVGTVGMDVQLDADVGEAMWRQSSVVLSLSGELPGGALSALRDVDVLASILVLERLTVDAVQLNLLAHSGSRGASIVLHDGLQRRVTLMERIAISRSRCGTPAHPDSQ